MTHDSDALVLAIDGQALAGDRPTGLGRVARAATIALCEFPDLSVLPLMPPDPAGFSRAWERFVWEQATLPCKAKDQHADVLYSPAFGCPRLSTVPRIHMIHDLIPRQRRWETGRASWYWAQYLPESASWAQAVITNSQATRLDLLRQVPVDPARVFVNPLGIPWDSATPLNANAEATWEARCPFDRYALFVGSLVPRKAPELLLAAVAQLRAQGMAIPLVLVGEGEPYRWELQAQTVRDGIADQCYWTSFVGEDELLRAIYTRADLLVSPSLAEGFNLPLIEAASCNTPVIASDLPVHREVLGTAGRYAPLGDVAALAQCLAELWQSTDARAEYATRGALRAGRYTWHAHAAGLVALARTLADRAPLPTAQAFATVRDQALTASAFA